MLGSCILQRTEETAHSSETATAVEQPVILVTVFWVYGTFWYHILHVCGRELSGGWAKVLKGKAEFSHLQDQFGPPYLRMGSEIPQ